MKNLFAALIFTIALLPSCKSQSQGFVMTVNGRIPAQEMGITLTHEHILVDFIGADSVSASRYNVNEVMEKVLPYLQEIKALGCQTFVECTPEYLGRDPQLLKRLSDETQLHILTNTGFYGVRNNKFIPSSFLGKSAEALLEIWIAEWENGIRGTGIKPGFIKIGVDSDSLSQFHTTLVEAAALTHLQSGLVIASHTGPSLPAFQQMEVLERYGVSPEAFIWVHAQSEKEVEKLSLAAEKGAWISLDYISEGNVDEIASLIRYLDEQGHLSRVLLSHDAGWFDPAKPGGGDFRGFTALFTKLIPTLENSGFTREKINRLLRENPARAFEVKVRRK
ncbi:MAG: hypothetical protein PHO94_00065 [Petrimonas sp.]|nr:hypothetical protein [Petrimonas sp.]